MVLGRLKVKGDQIIDIDSTNETPVILRGAGLGGWMNMENFITGFSGHEREHRKAMRNVLGQEKYEHFFDKWLDVFFTEEDADYFASLGLNCLRIPFNYQHFEDDMNPRVIKNQGFKYLDKVVKLCAERNIYTILDMHAVPGGQNPDWHADNPTNLAAFWDHKDFQDRTIWLWKEIASHYRGQPWIAGYNPLNEPADPEHTRVSAFYDRVEVSIREVDPDHILWFDGNTFAMDWRGFTRVLPNSVYSLHDYSSMGFPTGDRFKGTPQQLGQLEKQLRRKSEFMLTHKCPIWNGEFGPIYEDEGHEASSTAGNDSAKVINDERIALLGAQLRLYKSQQISWSIWLYKDIGLQGMVYTSPTSPWNRLVAPFLEKKKQTEADAWGRAPSNEVDDVMKPLVDWINKHAPGVGTLYPPVWDTKRHLSRVINEGLLSRVLTDEFAALFEGKSLAELTELAESFSFKACVQRETLNNTLREFAH